MNRALITTVPFAQVDPTPLRLLEEAGIEYVINPLGRKLTSSELASMIPDFDVIIAGTEVIDKQVLDAANKLRLISRVGVGLDGLDLSHAMKKGVLVSYTADAPAPAVSELTIGLLISLLRNIQLANSNMHSGLWNRYFGRRLSEVCIGIIGCGRIGQRVISHLLALGASKILINDPIKQSNFEILEKTQYVEKEMIYKEADVISLHVPLTSSTRNLICYEQLKEMKPDAILINTARGGIINESDLLQALKEGHLSGVAVDVFEREPYVGELSKFDQCILTSHMGSMSIDCRVRMEIEATEEAIRFLKGESLKGLVPLIEYQNHLDQNK
jgi:D-3-phosphoglycerate dehydrogenase